MLVLRWRKPSHNLYQDPLPMLASCFFVLVFISFFQFYLLFPYTMEDRAILELQVQVTELRKQMTQVKKNIK